MSEIFISFVHEEEKIAKAVQEYLREHFADHQNMRVFLSSDQWQIYAGEDWLDRIRQELTAAKIVILMFSKTSVERPWVNFEAGAAWLTNKVLIPVCYGDLPKESLPKPYSGIQGLNLPDEAYYLLTSVAHHLGYRTPMPSMQSLGTDESFVNLQSAIKEVFAIKARH